MKVYVLEVFWGDHWEAVAVYNNRESAEKEGQLVLSKSSSYVEYEIKEFDVKD